MPVCGFPWGGGGAKEREANVKLKGVGPRLRELADKGGSKVGFEVQHIDGAWQCARWGVKRGGEEKEAAAKLRDVEARLRELEDKGGSEPGSRLPLDPTATTTLAILFGPCTSSGSCGILYCTRTPHKGAVMFQLLMGRSVSLQTGCKHNRQITLSNR